MPVLDFEHLTVRYGAFTALDDVTLSLERGAIGLLGPNGAGKSTLIKSLLGLVTPASGRGAVLGLDIRRQSLLIRSRIGSMPEGDSIFPGLSAVGAVAYAAELTGMPKVEALQRAHETLYYLNVGEERYRRVETFSTGMKQRVKLAQALVHSPKLVFLDEPTNGLDPQGREDMLDLIEDIWKRRDITVLFSSHLLPDIERVCERVVVLHLGRVRLCGDIAHLRRFHGRGYTVKIEGDAASFIAAARQAGLACDADEEEHVLHLDLPEGLSAKTIFELARATGIELRRMEPRQQSLEEVFMATIDAAEHPASMTMTRA